DRARAAAGTGRAPPVFPRTALARAPRSAPPLPVGPLADGVAERDEAVARLAWDPSLRFQLAGRHRVRPEGVGVTARGDARRLDRLLRIHAEDRDVQEDLEHRLLLDVAARRAEGHEESTVGERPRRRR